MVTAIPPASSNSSKSENKNAQYVGDNLHLNLKGGKDKINFALVGNNCTVRVDDNNGSVKIIGNDNKIRITGGNGAVTYIGNRGKIILDHEVPPVVKYIGRNGEINNNTDKKSETSQVKVDTNNIKIRNFSGVRITSKNNNHPVTGDLLSQLNYTFQKAIYKTESKK